MTYTVERERHGRTETLVDVPRFAADLAEELGGTVLPHRLDDDHVDVRLDGLVLGVSGNRYGYKGKVRVTCSVADVPPGDRPINDGRGTYTMPDARVAVTRPMRTVARDVKRRVVDAAAEPVAATRAYARRQEEARGGLTRVLEDLRVKVPEMKEGGHSNTGNDSRSLWWEGAGHVYLNARVYSDGHVGIDRIGSVSLEAFVEIAGVLRRHSRKEGLAP